MRKNITVLICFLCALLTGTHAQTQLPADIDKYVDSVLSTFSVPGISLSVVKDGKVVLAKGYGIKRLGDTGRVNEHTLFPIASNTKAFTAMALAILMDEGKLHWDDPVVQYLPWFKMSDPWVTEQITVRDLLVHHSGIPAYAGDILLFPPSTYSRKEIIERLKDIPIIHSFRTTYAYDNILYVTAGEVVAAISGMDWQAFVRTHILEKIGMGETISRFTALNKSMNLATAHIRLRNTVTPADGFLEEDIGDAGDPCGGIASNAVDMATWMLTELDSGKAPNQLALIKPTSFKQLWNVVTPIPIPTAPAVLKPAQVEYYGYALGVRASNYGAFKVISHGGKLDGFVSHVLLVPKLHLGITVLTNQESTGAYMSVIYHLLDYYMQNPHYNWMGAYKQLLDTSIAEWKRDWDKAVVVPTASAPKPVAEKKYVGKYACPSYGDIQITKKDTVLQLQFVQTPQFNAVLQPLQYQTFTATFGNPALRVDAYVYFTLGPSGDVESCQLKVTDPDSDTSFDGLVFTKQNDK